MPATSRMLQTVHHESLNQSAPEFPLRYSEYPLSVLSTLSTHQGYSMGTLSSHYGD